MENWHLLTKKEVLTSLKTNETGLREEEAKFRLEKYGLNQLRKISKINPFLIFLRQFNSFLIYILFMAAIISGFLGNWIDSIAIGVIIVINSSIGFIQEYKAEEAIEKLKQLLVPHAKVLRGDRLKEILAEEVIPGDILVFSEGDKIMADGRIIYSEGLQTNEASLTGESMPSDKKTEKIILETPLAQRMNMIYTGTSVLRGSGKAIVTATGMQTEFGKIAGMVQRIKSPKTPLQEKLDIFAKKLGVVIILLSMLVAIVGIAFGSDKLVMFLTAVSLAVSAIPEGLPAVIAICLAITTKRMLKVNTLTRKLPAAETLGRTTVICTDKTGTLTSEQMVIREIYSDNKIIKIEEEIKGKGKEKEDRKVKFIFENKRINPKESRGISYLLKVGCLCNNARLDITEEKEYLTGDPTEKALLLIAKYAGINKKELTEIEPRIKEFTFTSERKMMSIVRESGNKKIAYVKGAPDVLLSKCTKEYVNGNIKELNTERKKELQKQYEKMESSALRVLAFAFKPLRYSLTQHEAESGLIFVGFQGMLDPPRPEVKPAIEKCQKAGIRIVMITGDSAITAKAISKEIGLEGEVITGIELDKLSEEELIDKSKKINIFARTTPKHKLRIVECFKKQNEIVAVTGDGVNDAPALKRADIGIAMGIRGTDVARDTADMVLVDDNFASIVNAIHEGRRSYSNIKKFVKYLFSVNFSGIALILFSLLARLPLPLLPLQILWINIVTDSLPALALSVEPAEKDIMQRKPRDPNEGILKGIIGFILLAGLLTVLIKGSIFLWSFYSGMPIEKTRTMVLTTGIMFEMFFVFTCRSKRSLKKVGFLSNKFLIGAVGIAILLHIIAIYSPLNIVLQLVPLGFVDWIKILGLACIGLVVFEAKKMITEKRKEKKKGELL